MSEDFDYGGASEIGSVVIGAGFRGPIKPYEIVFCRSRGHSERGDVLRFKPDGRVFVDGRLVTTDLEIVNALRSQLGLAPR